MEHPQEVRMDKSTSSGGLNTCKIPLGLGDWEILTASIHLGAYEIASIRCFFEIREGDGTIVDNHIMSGYLHGPHYPLILQSPKIVKGPGLIMTVGTHTGTFTHNLVITYRRVIE